MRLLAFIGGLAIGCGLAMAGSALLTDDEAPREVEQLVSTTLPQTTTTTPWVAADEIRFESTVLVPSTPSVENGNVVLEYELVNLGAPSEETAPPAAQPELWQLVTAAGEFSAETRHGASRVRFQVPAELTWNDFEVVRLVGWRSVLPIDSVFTIAAAAGAEVALPDGAMLRARNTLEQASGTLVTFDITRSPDPFSSGSPDPFLMPTADSGWRVAWGDSYQVFADNASPETIELRYTKPLWLPTAGDLVVWVKP